MVVSFEIPQTLGPALRSAVDEFSRYLSDKVEGLLAPHATEKALTEAVAAVGSLRAAVFRAVPKGHPHWPELPPSRR